MTYFKDVNIWYFACFVPEGLKAASYFLTISFYQCIFLYQRNILYFCLFVCLFIFECGKYLWIQAFMLKHNLGHMDDLKGHYSSCMHVNSACSICRIYKMDSIGKIGQIIRTRSGIWEINCNFRSPWTAICLRHPSQRWFCLFSDDFRGLLKGWILHHVNWKRSSLCVYVLF